MSPVRSTSLVMGLLLAVLLTAVEPAQAWAGRTAAATPGPCPASGCLRLPREARDDAAALLQGEIRLARLALQRSRTPLVLHVAMRVLSTYEPLLPRLQAGASEPSGAGGRLTLRALEVGRQRLESLKGAAFDVEYLAPFAHRQRQLLLLLESGRRSRAVRREAGLPAREAGQAIEAALLVCRQHLELGERILARMMVPPISALDQ